MTDGCSERTQYARINRNRITGPQVHRALTGPEKRNWQSKRLQRRNDYYAMKWIVFGLPTVAQFRNIPLIPVFRKDVDRGTVL